MISLDFSRRGLDLLFIKIPIILTLHTNNLRPNLGLGDVAIDDHGGQPPAFDAASIEAFAVWFQLEAKTRVVAVDYRRALVSREEGLVFIPQLQLI